MAGSGFSRDKLSTAQLARLPESAGHTNSQEAGDRLLQERIEAGGVEIGGGVADDRDLLEAAEFGDPEPRLVAEHGRLALVERGEFELILERTRAEGLLRDEKPKGDDPFRRRGGVEEREADLGAVLDADPDDPALRPLGRGEAIARQFLDSIHDLFEDSTIPACRASVGGDPIAGMPLPAVNFPGGLGCRERSVGLAVRGGPRLSSGLLSLRR